MADGRFIYLKAVQHRPAASPGASNSFETSDAVSVRRSRVVAGPFFSAVLPKHSAAVVTLRARG